MDKTACRVFSSGLRGAEAAFGEEAARWGVAETVYTFAGQETARDEAAEVVVLTDEELRRGDISMEIVSQMMHRTYYESERIRKVLQTLFHVVNSGHQVFVVGTIQEDNTVKGGTGWAVELAKLFNRPLHVYGQVKKQWYTWEQGAWVPSSPRIESETIACSGTRNLTDDGRRAIADLFAQAFG